MILFYYKKSDDLIPEIIGFKKFSDFGKWSKCPPFAFMFFPYTFITSVHTDVNPVCNLNIITIRIKPGLLYKLTINCVFHCQLFSVVTECCGRHGNPSFLFKLSFLGCFIFTKILYLLSCTVLCHCKNIYCYIMRI